MTDSPRSTRRLALLAVGLAALVATAGCAGSIGGLGGGDGGGDAGDGPRLDSVPASAESVAYVDVGGMRDDESLRSIANTALDARSEVDPDAPADVEALFDRAGDESGLDPGGVVALTAYDTGHGGEAEPGEGSSATLLSTSYSESDVVDAVENRTNEADYDVELTEETYGDTTLYAFETDTDDGDREYDGVLAVLGDGEFAVGDRSAVEGVVDVRNGDEEAVGGDLRAAFEDTDADGYVRAAMALDDRQVAPGEDGTPAVGGTELNASAVQSVEYVSTSFATGDGNVTTTVNLHTGSSGDAEQLYELADGALALYSNVGDSEAQSALSAVSVDRSGSTVTVAHSDTVEAVESHVETLYGVAPSGGSANTAAVAAATDAPAATPAAGVGAGSVAGVAVGAAAPAASP